jgi:thioredoxin reductase
VDTRAADGVLASPDAARDVPALGVGGLEHQPPRAPVHPRRVPRYACARDFVRYGEWFRQQAAPEIDEREVVRIEPERGEFRVVLADGDELTARRVVVATGLALFAARPRQFEGLTAELASHTAEHTDFNVFAGRRVLVVGGGQSALESAALLHEAGAQVSMAVRAPQVRWLPPKRMTGRLAPARKHFYRPVVHRLLYPPTDVGPPGLNWIVALPRVFRTLPFPLQDRIARRCIRPAGADWLRSRVAGVEIATARSVASAAPVDGRVRVEFEDGSIDTFDHVLLATGFRVDVRRLPFLTQESLRCLAVTDGYPVLRSGFESSVPGLHFVGAPAARSFGPVMRFVSGTHLTGPELARGVLRGRERGASDAGVHAARASADVARSV